MKTKCDACGYEGKIDHWGCPKCKGMGNYLWMEDVQSLSVEASDLIDEKLAEYGIKLNYEQEDKIHNAIWETLESVSNGYYRHHN